MKRVKGAKGRRYSEREENDTPPSYEEEGRKEESYQLAKV